MGINKKFVQQQISEMLAWPMVPTGLQAQKLYILLVFFITVLMLLKILIVQKRVLHGNFQWGTSIMLKFIQFQDNLILHISTNTGVGKLVDFKSLFKLVSYQHSV